MRKNLSTILRLSLLKGNRLKILYTALVAAIGWYTFSVGQHKGEYDAFHDVMEMIDEMKTRPQEENQEES